MPGAGHGGCRVQGMLYTRRANGSHCACGTGPYNPTTTCRTQGCRKLAFRLGLGLGLGKLAFLSALLHSGRRRVCGLPYRQPCNPNISLMTTLSPVTLAQWAACTCHGVARLTPNPGLCTRSCHGVARLTAIQCSSVNKWAP